MIRILLVDDQPLIRQGIAMLLGTVPGLAVVGEAADGHEALAMVDRLHPDIVLTDARMPGMDGLALVAAARDRFPALPLIVLTTFDDEDIVRGALLAGASGFLLKNTSLPSLAEAIRAVAGGGMVIDPKVTRLALSPADPTTDEPLAVLSRAERLVAERVARGDTNQEIADSLVITEGTVKNHITNLLRKLEKPNRTALALHLYAVLHDATDRPS